MKKKVPQYRTHFWDIYTGGVKNALAHTREGISKMYCKNLVRNDHFF